MGVIYALQGIKLNKLTPSDLAGIPIEKFDEWKKTELKSIYFYLLATWGVLIVSKVATRLITPHFPSGAFAINSSIEIAFVVLLIVSAVFGSKAKKLKKSLGILWPKKSALHADQRGET
jgi:hypothetical protein